MDACIENIFSHFVLSLSILKYLLMKSNLSVFSFISVFCILLEKFLPILMKLLSYIIFYKCYCFTYHNEIYDVSETSFVYGVRKGVRFIDLALFIEKTVLLSLHFMGKFCAISEVCMWKVQFLEPLFYSSMVCGLSFLYHHT